MEIEMSLKIASRWAAKKYNAGIGTRDGLILYANTLNPLSYFLSKTFPYSKQGILSACEWIRKINQDIYEPLPKI
jgi:hypothetical protein